jgi:hypothetical protein
MFTMNGFVRFKGQQGFYELSSFGALNCQSQPAVPETKTYYHGECQ